MTVLKIFEKNPGKHPNWYPWKSYRNITRTPPCIYFPTSFQICLQKLQITSLTALKRTLPCMIYCKFSNNSIPVILQFVRENYKFCSEIMCSENLRNLISININSHQELKQSLNGCLIKDTK